MLARRVLPCFLHALILVAVVPAAFEWLWGMPELPTSGAPYRILESLGARDEGMSPQVRDARLQRERESLASLEDKRSRITTLEQFQVWHIHTAPYSYLYIDMYSSCTAGQNFLFMEHRLYAVRYQDHATEQLSDLSPAVRDSY